MMEKINLVQNPLSWNELKDEAMRYWGKLKHEDFNKFQGDFNSLKMKVKNAYNYTEEELDDEFKAFLRKWKKRSH